MNKANTTDNRAPVLGLRLSIAYGFFFLIAPFPESCQFLPLGPYIIFLFLEGFGNHQTLGSSLFLLRLTVSLDCNVSIVGE